jgi:hypothetical protein
MPKYGALFAPGALVFAAESGGLVPAADATVTILNASSDVPTFYTSRTDLTPVGSPDLTTDDNGNWGPYWLPFGAGYSYTAIDSAGHSHGPYYFTVEADPAEPFVPPTSDPLVTGAVWNDTGTLAISAG